MFCHFSRFALRATILTLSMFAHGTFAQGQATAESIGSSSSSGASQTSLIPKKLRKAQSLSDAEQYQQAIECYAQVLAIDPDITTAQKGMARARRAQILRKKLATLVLPRLSFSNTRLADAVEFLRQESRRLDTENTGDEPGVEIELRLPKPVAMASSGSESIPGLPEDAIKPRPDLSFPVGLSENTRISLALYNIPLLEALRYTAQQVGMKVKVEENSVAFIPIPESDGELRTVEFRVRPNLISDSNTAEMPPAQDATDVGVAKITRIDAKAFLEASGLTFPPGTSAVYFPDLQKLIIRNLKENIDLLEGLPDYRSENAAPTPTNP